MERRAQEDDNEEAAVSIISTPGERRGRRSPTLARIVKIGWAVCGGLALGGALWLARAGADEVSWQMDLHRDMPEIRASVAEVTAIKARLAVLEQRAVERDELAADVRELRDLLLEERQRRRELERERRRRELEP